MTRSHKYNDKEHTADGVVMHHENIPKFFGKNGFADADPKKIKKNGGGKANWGNAGEELMDEPDFNFTNARRRSNSSGLLSQEQMRTKFEFNEPEPVFEEDLHGPEEVLHKTETSSSGGSIDKD